MTINTMPIIWALGFANPALLYGLAAASVPILIHLLNRRKFREVPWAAMRFLLAAIKKNQRRIRIEQWLLLAVRTLIILLVVSAMAKPFLESLGAVIVGRRVHRVLVLDASLSMGYTSGGSTRFDQARALAVELVKGSRQGDAISVILMGRPPRMVIGAPSNNLREVEKEISDLAITHEGTDLTATLRMVDHVLDASTIPQKEVVFLTDLQTTSWRPPQGADEGLKQALARIVARQPHSILFDLGEPNAANRAVTDLRLEVPVVTLGTSVLIRGVVHNYGPNRVDGLRARLTVDGRLSPAAAPESVAAGDDLPVVFRHEFTIPGDHVVELVLDSDSLPLDDRRWLVVPVRESLRVLLVDGSFRSEPYQAETDYLAQALSPTEVSPGQPSAIRVEVAGESQLASRELAAYDAVVLCNVAQFSQPEVSALEDYLKQGGGVVIFGGDQVVADNYNRLLYRDGQGLLPASIGPSIGDAAKKQAGYFFNPLRFRHPLVAEFQGEADPVTAGLTRVMTWQYHKLILPRESKAQVALSFDRGDPAVIEWPHERGTVILVATSADTGWTSWPIHKSYPPVMQQMVLRAAAGRLSEQNIRVGQPYLRSFAEASASAPVTIVTPAGRTLTTKLDPKDGVSQLKFEQTELSGEYKLRIGTAQPVESSFAANADPVESDLAKLDEAALGEILPGWKFIYVHPSDWKALTRDAASVGRRGELHRPMLYAVLVLLLVESFLAWRFGHHEPQ